jgi:hypothetical protein
MMHAKTDGTLPSGFHRALVQSMLVIRELRKEFRGPAFGDASRMPTATPAAEGRECDDQTNGSLGQRSVG